MSVRLLVHFSVALKRWWFFPSTDDTSFVFIANSSMTISEAAEGAIERFSNNSAAADFTNFYVYWGDQVRVDLDASLWKIYGLGEVMTISNHPNIYHYKVTCGLWAVIALFLLLFIVVPAFIVLVVVVCDKIRTSDDAK